MSETTTLIERLKAAHKELCDGVDRQWHGGAALKMSIPARPDHDSDLLIGAAIREAEVMLADLQRRLDESLSVSDSWRDGAMAARSERDSLKQRVKKLEAQTALLDTCIVCSANLQALDYPPHCDACIVREDDLLRFADAKAELERT